MVQDVHLGLSEILFESNKRIGMTDSIRAFSHMTQIFQDDDNKYAHKPEII